MNEKVQKYIRPCNVFRDAERLLSRSAENEYVNFNGTGIPTNESGGAGSEKLSYSGCLDFKRMIFAPMKDGHYLTTSLGEMGGQINTNSPIITDHEGKDPAFPYTPKMSGFFRIILPEEVIKKIFEISKSSGENPNRHFDYAVWGLDYALTEIIRRNNSNYRGMSLFAFDGEVKGSRQGFFKKTCPLFSGEYLGDFLGEYIIGGSNGYSIPYTENEEGQLSNNLANRLNPKNIMISDEIPSLIPKRRDKETKKDFFLWDPWEYSIRTKIDEIMKDLNRK